MNEQLDSMSATETDCLFVFVHARLNPARLNPAQEGITAKII